MDRLYPPVAETLIATLENPFDGIGGFHRGTRDCSVNGLVNFPCRIRSFNGRATMRLGSRWYPMRRLSTLRGCSGRIRKRSYSPPWKGCCTLLGCVIFRVTPRESLWGPPGDQRPIKQHENHKTKPVPHHSRRSFEICRLHTRKSRAIHPRFPLGRNVTRMLYRRVCRRTRRRMQPRVPVNSHRPRGNLSETPSPCPWVSRPVFVVHPIACP